MGVLESYKAAHGIGTTTATQSGQAQQNTSTAPVSNTGNGVLDSYLNKLNGVTPQQPSREEQIANQFAQQTPKIDSKGNYTNDQRDALLREVEQLQSVRPYLGDPQSMQENQKRMAEIHEQLHTIDAQLGNQQQDYDREQRAMDFLKSWAKNFGGSALKTVGTLGDFGREGNLEDAIANARTSNWEEQAGYLGMGAANNGEVTAPTRTLIDIPAILANIRKESAVGAETMLGYGDGRTSWEDIGGNKDQYASIPTDQKNWLQKTEAERSAAIGGTGGRLIDESAAQYETARGGLNKAQGFAMDVARGGLDLLADQALNRILPGSGMVRMSVGAFGNAAHEVEQNGGDINQQVMAGTKAAAIEYMTEKIAGIGGRYTKTGEGIIDDATKRLIEKFAGDNRLKGMVANMVAGFGSEFAEEALSGVLNPITDYWLGLSDTIDLDWGQIAYEGLIGGLLGLGGGYTSGRQYNQQQMTAAIEAAVKQEADKAIANATHGLVTDSGVLINRQADTSAQRLVVKYLADLTQENAAKIAGDNRLASAFEELTGQRLSGNTEAATEQILALAQNGSQEATGATQTQDGEITPPTTQTNEREALEEFNNNSRENEAQETAQATEEAQDQQIEQPETQPEQAVDTLTEESQQPKTQTRIGPKRGSELATWALGLDQQGQNQAREGEGIDVDASSDRDFIYRNGNYVTTAPGGNQEAAVRAAMELSEDEALPKYNVVDEDGWGIRSNTAAYNDVVDTAIEEVLDDQRAVSRIMNREGAFSDLSPQEAADLLNYLSTTNVPGENRPYISGRGEYYVSGNEVVLSRSGNSSYDFDDDLHEGRNYATEAYNSGNGARKGRYTPRSENEAPKLSTMDRRLASAERDQLVEAGERNRNANNPQRAAFKKDAQERERKQNLRFDSGRKTGRAITDELYGYEVQALRSKEKGGIDVPGILTSKAGNDSLLDRSAVTKGGTKNASTSNAKRIYGRTEGSFEERYERDRPRFDGPSSDVDRQAWERASSTYEKEGARIIPPHAWSKSFKDFAAWVQKAGANFLTIADAGGNKNVPLGFTSKDHPGAGVFSTINNNSNYQKAGFTPGGSIVHEVVHNGLVRNGGETSRRSIAESIFEHLGIATEVLDNIYDDYSIDNAVVYLNISREAFRELSREDIKNMLMTLDSETAQWYSERVFEEILGDFASGDQLDVFRSIDAILLSNEARKALIEAGIFDDGAFEGVDDLIDAFNEEAGNFKYKDEGTQLLNQMSAEEDELANRERRNEEERYQEQRYSDKQQTNAKEYARDQRDAKKQQEAAIYDPERSFGGETYGRMQQLGRDLEKATTKEAGTKEDPGKRDFNGDYDGASEVIGNFYEVIAGTKSFGEFADSYTDLEGTAFYDKELAEALDTLRRSIDTAEKARDYDGTLPKALSSEAERLSRQFVKRIQRAGEIGVADRTQVNDELSNATSGKKKKTGYAKLFSDLAKKYKGSQLRPDVMFRTMAGYARDTKLYQLAEQSKEVVKRKINMHQTALEYFNKATQMDGYNDFATGKTKIDNPIPGHSERQISLNTALGLLKVLETNGAIDHIVRNGAQFAVSEKELYSGINRNGFSTGSGYAQDIPMLSKATQKLLREAGSGKELAHARSRAASELKALRDTLKAEIMKNEITRTLYEASSDCMRYLGREINTTSNEMWGVDFATEGDNYYPLEIASKGNTRELLNDRTNALKSAGIVQERTGPGGRLRIRPFTDTMSGYINQATDWASYSELSDRLELMSRNHSGSTSMTAQLAKTHGEYFAKWMEDYVADLNNARHSDTTMGRLRSNLASAALTLNGGVALKQSPSYFDAAGVIDLDILRRHVPGLFKTAKSFDNNPLIQEVELRSRALQSRRMGYSAVEVGEATDNARTLSNKVNSILPNWATNWIQKTDYRTTSNLMLACADQVMRDNPGLKQGSDDYYEAIAAKFEEVLMQTQPIYNKQFRAAYMRSTNEVVRTLAMFRTQQTQNFNQLMDAWGEYQANKDDSTRARLRSTITGHVVASTMFGILSAAARAGLHRFKDFEDDEGNFDIGKTSKRVFLNALGAAAGTFWFGGEVLNLALDAGTGAAAHAYNKAHKEEIEAGELEKKVGLSESSDFGDSTLSMIDDFGGDIIAYANNPSVGTFRDVLFSASQLTGIPTKNLYNLLNSATMFALDGDRALTGGAAWNDGKESDIIKLISNWNKKSAKDKAKATAAAAVRAYGKGNTDKADTLLSTLDYSDDDIKKAAEKEIRNSFIFGGLTAEQFSRVMKGFIKADNVAAMTRGYQVSKDYYDETSEEDIAKDKAAIDADHNGRLTQDELYNFYLENSGKKKTVEAIWNAQGFNGENALWETYIAGKKKREAYDRLALENADNPAFQAIQEQLKSYKKGAVITFQNQTGDRAIMDAVMKMNLSDDDADTVLGMYISSKNMSNYNTLRGTGATASKAINILKAVDALGEGDSANNGSISQKELVAYYKAHPDEEAYVEALWNAQGYTKKGQPNLWDKSKVK